MNIYLKNETKFDNNGLGFLTDIISANVTDEINGEYSLSLEYPINGRLSEYLVEENFIKCKVADGSKQTFIIKNATKTFDKIKVYAKHIFYTLLDNFLEDVAPTNQNGTTFLNWILDRTNYSHKFKGYSDITVTKSARYVRKNPVEAIIGADNSMVNLFNGELKRDNYDIHFNSKIGIDNGVKLSFGKNITGINITIDTSSTYTRIMPQGFDGLLLPEKYIDSPLINNYPNPKIYKVEFENIKYDPEDEEAYHNLDEAYEALRNEVELLYQNGIDKPQINIKIDWIELSKTNEFKQYSELEKVNLGDTITANILGINIITRVIKTIYNPLTDMITKFEIGTPKADIGSTQNYLEKQIEKINPTSILEQAKENATNLINSGFGGNVRVYPDKILIMDTNSESTAKNVWQWNINGLGFSSTGVDGKYGLAMTIDGQIVADFITTGKLNTSVIEGYDSLIQQVQKIYVFTNEVSNKGSVITTNGREGGLISLSITGEIEALYPSDDLYPDDNLYPLDVDMYLVLLNKNGNQRILLPIEYLYELNNISDEFQIYSIYDDTTENYIYKARVIRRIELDEMGNKTIAHTETIEELGNININLYTGDTTIKMESFENIMLDVNYYINNDITNSFATKAYVSSSIKQTEDSINLEVSKKVGNDEIISRINQSPEEVSINAEKISLDGKNIDLTSDNISITSNNFIVDEYGNIECNNAVASNLNITGGNINLTDNASVSNAVFNLTSLDKRHTARICSKSISIDSDYRTPNYSEAIITPTTMLISSNDASFAIFNEADDSRNNYIEYVTNGVTIFRGNGYGFTYYNGSLKELKKNIKLNKFGLELIKNTDIYTFNYKNEDNNYKKHIGVIIGDKYKTPTEILNDDNTGVDTYSMVSVCFQAIKEQQEIIEKLEKRIEVLENEK